MRRLAVSTFLIGLLIGTLASPALAYGRDDSGSSCPQEPVLAYDFDGSGWNSTREGYFEDGAGVWDEIKGGNGDPIISTSEGGAIEIKIDFTLGVPGETTCYEILGINFLNYLSFDPDEIAALGSEAQSFEGIAAHEGGHAHGLHHSGDIWETWDGDYYPTMALSGCIHPDDAVNGVNYLTSLQQDDYAQVSRWYTSGLHANAGFEHDELFWGVGGGGDLTAITSGGAKYGDTYARLNGDFGGYTFQTVVVRGFQAVVGGGGPGEIDARTWYKKSANSATGTATITVKSKRFSTTDAHASQDQCHPGVTGWATELSDPVTPTTSWQKYTSSVWDADAEWGDGVIVRIYVYNYLSHNQQGKVWNLKLDATKARHR